MVVHTTDDGDFEAVAERIAAERDESVVTAFETALASTEAVVWVDQLSSFTPTKLLSLQRRLADRGREDGAFGLITGYTAENAEDLYFSSVETNGEDLLLFSRHLDPIMPDRLPDFSAEHLLTEDETTADVVEEVTSEPLRSFEIAAAGRQIHVNLSDGYICGFPESQRIEDYPDPQPFCVTDGERDCPLSGTLVPAESIDAAHVSVLSCTTSIHNGSAGLPVHPVMGLLNGAESLIGSYRVATTRAHELLLHHGLLASGYDVAERCHLLNENSNANDLMARPYIAFGRPGAAVDDAHEPQFDVEIRSDDAVDVRLTDVDAYVVDLEIPNERLPSDADRLYVRTTTDFDVPLYYAIFEEGDATRLLVYSGGRMQADRIGLEISDWRRHHVEHEIAIDSVNNVPHMKQLGFFDGETTAQVEQLENQMRALVRATRDERFVANLDESIEQRLDSIRGNISHVRDSFVSFLRDNPATPYRIYSGNTVPSETYTLERTCPYCNDGPIFVERSAACVGDGERLLGSCGRCGPIFNAPGSEGEHDLSYPIVRCDLKTDGERRQPVEISFENATDAPMRATFQPVVDDVDNAENAFFEPETEDAVLLPDESHTAEFTIDTNLLSEYRYKIRGQVVGNLDLYTGVNSTILGEEAGYYPPRLR